LRRFIDDKIFAGPEGEKRTHHLYNLGISGDTSTGVLKRFSTEIDARLLRDKDCAVMFAIGTNDSQFILADQDNRTPLPEFSQNISALILEARKYTQKIAFIGLPPVDDARVNPIPWSPQRAFVNGEVKKFDTALQEICARESLPFIDVFSLLSSGDFTQLLQDGVHPNDAGHAMMFEATREFLIKAGWI
jgi:lysophospholipase L1-like esterase